jgi:hypothetical protein
VKLINAFWEERNLGLKSCEIIFEKKDLLDLNLMQDLKNKYKYIVAKVPEGDIPLVHKLENEGFHYIENKFHYSAESHNYQIFDKKYLEHYKNVHCQKVSDTLSYNLIKKEVHNHLFEFDRITLDPYFDNEVASLRHTLWIEDLFKNETVETYLLKNREKDFGFFMFEKRDENYFIPMAGIFEKFQKTGLAFFLIYFPFKIAAEDGVKTVEAIFSSNNTAIINLVARLTKFQIIESFILLRGIS